MSPIAATADAKRIASAILDVLAGVRSITDTALMLGIAPPRYYALEARALAGFIAACEPRLRGALPGAALQSEIDRLRLERDRLRDEAARYQTLARIAASAFGTPTPPGGGARTQSPPTAGTTRTTLTGKVAKKRRASVRALRLSQEMRVTTNSTASANGISTSPARAIIPESDQAGG